MKIQDFIKTLPPSIERGAILEDIENVRRIIRDVAQPLFEKAAFLKSHTWQSKLGKDAQSKWTFHARNAKGNWVGQTTDILENTDKILSVLDRLVGKHFSDETYRDAMSFLKANILMVANYAQFYVDFSIRLLNAVAAEESIAINRKQRYESRPAPSELKFLEENLEGFARIGDLLTIKSTDVDKKVLQAPDSLVELDVIGMQIDSISASKGKADPLSLGFIPVRYNPAAWIAKMAANFLHDRYEANEAEMRTVEMRLAFLQSQLKGDEGDAQIERSIAVNQERHAKLRRKVEKYKESVDEYA